MTAYLTQTGELLGRCRFRLCRKFVIVALYAKTPFHQFHQVWSFLLREEIHDGIGRYAVSLVLLARVELDRRLVDNGNRLNLARTQLDLLWRVAGQRDLGLDRNMCAISQDDHIGRCGRRDREQGRDAQQNRDSWRMSHVSSRFGRGKYIIHIIYAKTIICQHDASRKELWYSYHPWRFLKHFLLGSIDYDAAVHRFPTRDTGWGCVARQQPKSISNGWDTKSWNGVCECAWASWISWAVDGRTIVFVEVKTWQNPSGCDHPADAVDLKKQRQLTRAGTAYLKHHGLLEYASRFDIIAVTWSEGKRRPKIEHIKNAFEAVGRGEFYS